MTKAEIKKALRIHTDDEAGCAECPYYNCGNCRSVELLSDVLSLIAEEEQEIARLKKELKEVKEKFVDYVCKDDTERQELLQKIFNLEKQNASWEKSYASLYKRCEKTIEKAKKQAERVERVWVNKAFSELGIFRKKY